MSGFQDIGTGRTTSTAGWRDIGSNAESMNTGSLINGIVMIGVNGDLMAGTGDTTSALADSTYPPERRVFLSWLVAEVLPPHILRPARVALSGVR